MGSWPVAKFLISEKDVSSYECVSQRVSAGTTSG